MKTQILTAAIVVASLSSTAFAQYTYHPVTSEPAQSPPTYYDHASTFAEGYLRGHADLRRGLGEYNYNTALSLRHLEEARSRHLDNRKKQAETFFQMRALNRAARAAERGPRVTIADTQRYAKMNAPARLASHQYSPELSRIYWPASLQADFFTAERQAIDTLFRVRTTADSGKGSHNHTQVEAISDAMAAKLKAQINLMSPSDYAAAKKFITSVKRESSYSVGLSGLASR